MRPTLLFTLLVSVVLTLPAYADKHNQIALQLQWKHQFEFAGFYAAIAKGFYTDAGLDVKLFEFHEGLDQVQEVLSGRKQFGIWGDGVLQSYMQGKPIVMVANYFKRSPLILLTRPDIHSPLDLRGKKIMISSMDSRSAGYLQMLQKFKIDPSEITIVPPSFEIQDFIEGKVDAYSAFSTNEPFVLRQQGVVHNVLDYNNYGSELYDVNLFTSKKYALENPKKVQAFVQASNRGWNYALKHSDEIIDLILRDYNSQHKSREALVFEYQESLKVILQDIYPIGSIDPEKIYTMGNVFGQNGLAVPLKNYQDFIFEKGGKNKLPLTAEEQAYLSKKGRIIMCVDPDWMPFERINENGIHEGMAADLLAIMQQRSGINLELLPTTGWSESIGMAKTRQCDIFSLAMATPDRREYMDFTTPYLSFPFVIATGSDKVFIDRIEQVLDKPLALVKGYAYTEILKRRYPDASFIEVDNLKAGLQLLRDNRVYGYIDALAPIAYTIQKEGMSEIKIAGKFDDSWDLAIGTRDDEPLLLSVMQKMIDTLTTKEKRASYNTWFSVKFESDIDYTIIWKILLGALFLCAIILYWNRKLYAAKNATQQALDKLAIAQQQLGEKNRNLEHQSKLLIKEIEVRKRAEEDQFKSEKRFGTMFIEAPLGIALTDSLTGVFHEVNPRFAEIAGITREEMTTIDWGCITHPDDVQESLHNMALLNDGKISSFNIKKRFIRPGGSLVWINMTVASIKNEDESDPHHLCMIEDITEQKKMTDQLLLNSKQATIVGLAAGVAHEINTPLSAILQAHQLVELGLSPEESDSIEKAGKYNVDLAAVQEYFKNNELDYFMAGIREAALKADRIIKSLLEFSRPHAGGFARADLEEIMENSLLLSQTDYDMKKKYGVTNIKVEKEYEPNLPPITCVTTEIEQVILNLIENSAQAMANTDMEEKPRLILRTAINGERAVIEVEDNGPGIAEDVINHIFDPFFTTREVGGGTGLGLSVSYAIIVDKHRGDIRVESEPGQGAKFIVEFPINQES